MIEENPILSLSQRLQKKEMILEKHALNGVLYGIKGKKDNISEFYANNKSTDFLENKGILINKLKKVDENKNYNNININKINFLNNKAKYSQKLDKKPFHHLFEINVNKRLFEKKKLLEKILYNKRPSLLREKSRVNGLNSKIIKLSKISSNSNLLMNDSLINEQDMNKLDQKKIKNEIIQECGKTGSNNNMTYIQEKIEQINMNKTALFKKIKFESLKKFCKNVKLNDKKIGYPFLMKKAISNKNELRKNNTNENKIKNLKEKVRFYFIGKFNSIKEYFEDWDEQQKGKININNIYNYLNKKIKYKISKNEVRKLIILFNNKNYLDLDNFRIFFFEDSPRDKLCIKGSKYLEYNDNNSLLKYINEFSHINNINKSESNCSISFIEKFKYNELIHLILGKKDNILSQINKERIELTFIEFYSIIRTLIKEKKTNFDKEIKKLFNDNKEKNSDLLNIIIFFEKINIKKDENKKNHSLINIKKHMGQGIIKPFYNKTKSSFFELNSRNNKNTLNYKDSNQTKTNFILDKIIYKDMEENKKNSMNSFNFQFKNINLNNINKFNFNSSKLSCGNTNFNACQTNENMEEKNQEYNNDNNYSKIMNLKLPNINKHEKNKNRNSDIIEFLNS